MKLETHNLTQKKLTNQNINNQIINAPLFTDDDIL